jgi:hypothetical protein
MKTNNFASLPLKARGKPTAHFKNNKTHEKPKQPEP